MNKIEEIVIMTADLGEVNPMPDIKNVGYIHAGFEVKPSLNEEEKQYLGKGMIPTLLPYMNQDGYDRVRKPKPHKAVVLENEYLKAVFLPEYGARLWSLYDKKAKKDLLYTNTVIQPCNFALRNAWFSGGVEFNVGIKGHNPFTCSPMFAEFIGDDAVRFYEYERIRGVAYGITAYLPEGSEVLYIRPRIENTKDEPVYTYWWSNIAFPETENTRTIVPATDAIHCLYQENHYVVDKEEIPISNGVDVSYSMNLGPSSDYFYKIPENEDKWIAAVDKNGNGLLHYSDRLLKGRKLFLWGSNVGGRHWNEFLSEEGQAYIEIQAGLLNTQLEHIPMPAHSVWEWTEGYTYVNGDNPAFYGDWSVATQTIKKALCDKVAKGTAVGFDELDKMVIDGNVKRVFVGSSWGYIENKLRSRFGASPISTELDFNAECDEEAKDFDDLLEKGYIPYRSPSVAPKSYVAGQNFNELLVKSLDNPKGNHWYTYLQVGVNEYACGNIEKAVTAFKQSISLEPSLWAYRNLAMIYLNEKGDKAAALDCLAEAYDTEIGKTTYAFIKEYAQVLVNYGEGQRFIDIYATLPEEIKNRGRIRVYYANALLNVGRAKEASKIITPDFVLCDVKEGELSISKLWTDIYTAIIAERDGIDSATAFEKAKKEYPIPYAIDFRMHG